MSPLELWAGPECTVTRIGDTVRDQLEETGFAQRLDDLDRLAELGVRCVRMPLLWERCARHATDTFDWRWTDTRLARLRLLGLPCIAGLVHHGGGPPGTDLLDPGFAPGLACYARALARRHPQLDAYTPVNEPLTTARFCGLYGVWHPHRRDDAGFVRALLNEIHATTLAMRAVREVNPAARLVQTDDLGFTRATPRLQYQADFDNERRWLGFDLLCGRVDRRHPLWCYLREHGASEKELMELVDTPCPPDLVGLNVYVTSERFLDHRVARYPAALHGGNGRHRYADVETVRVHGSLPDGVEARLREAWDRYGQPVALTEAHLGCSREEQMRWLHQAWQGAERARADRVDVRAVTAWAAFGTVDWNSLLTRRAGRYEAGLWDVRSDPPRPTGLAHVARQLAADRVPEHAVLASSGWWQRRIRHRYPAHGERQALAMSGRPVLIAGAGTLGRAFVQLCHLRGLPCRLADRAALDIADGRAVEAAILRERPWALVNAAGFVRVDEAQVQTRQWRDNVLGPSTLAKVCASHGVPLVTFSSDLVFDGRQDAPYVESDSPQPLSAYGEAKAECERRVLAHSADALVIRTAAFFGPWDRSNFVVQGLEALRRGERWRAASDQVVSPTYVKDLVSCTLDLLVDGERGLWHLANEGCLSWFEFARMAAQCAGFDVAQVDAVPGSALGQVAPRPRQSALTSERGRLMPLLDDALARCLLEADLR
ncbi:MAG TPA: SDR family oxidoreductase [Albitalea sp.]|uniref:SDR family oxidoreductase n=1 Tax=Piscinibacter sp. TaxID=1903157 RepID=UPI002ED6BE96